jgi:TatD DNase family protein
VIDTHAHLDGCEAAPSKLLERARAAGVDRVITIGSGIASCRVALEIARKENGVFAALGIHPHQAGGPEASDEAIAELEALVADERAVAVGETGLDFYRDWAPRQDQRRLFRAQIELASRLGRPVVIHNRDADAELATALALFDGPVILHCFSSTGLLPIALERGYYVSFAGNLTFAKAGELREAACQVPADRILAETDSPYLAPEPLRGRPNEPANVVHTVSALAEVRGEDAAELAARIDSNATAAFRLSVAAPAP